MPCRTCGCPGHAPSKTWEVRCSRCAGLRWPYAPSKPEAHMCIRCRWTSPAKREAARVAGKKSAARRLAKAALR
jgi:hypothetical protein